MDVRELARGTVDWDRLETVARELAERNDREVIRVEFPQADNWLSTPLIVNDEWFVKVVSGQNALVHAVFTGARNLGAVSAGSGGIFEAVLDPLGMAEHELIATERMRDVGVNAPAPLDAFEVDGLGVVVLEYLPSFRTLEELDRSTVTEYVSPLFEDLASLHDAGIVHGDLRAENVLIHEGELYFIDATVVNDAAASDDTAGVADGAAYDLACALAILAPKIGARTTVDHALVHFDRDPILRARAFLDFVQLRPDHQFDAAELKLAVEHALD